MTRLLSDFSESELKAEYEKWVGFRVDRTEAIKSRREEIERLEGFITLYKSEIPEYENDLVTIAEYLEVLEGYLGRNKVSRIESSAPDKDELLEWYKRNNPKAKVSRL